MKDRQITPVSLEPRVFLLSAALHCVSMTALVFLRSSFGYGFLRPKSIFFAFSWAFILYAIYAWIDRNEWQAHRSLLFFLGGSLALYWMHLLIAFTREWKQTGEHDRYSGNSHLLRLTGLLRQAPAARLETKTQLWAEPGIVLVLSAIAWLLGASLLSIWFGIVALCCWTKEMLNQWYHLRHRKRQQDVFTDTEETVEPPTTGNLASESPRAIRRTRIHRPRTAEVPTSDANG